LMTSQNISKNLNSDLVVVILGPTGSGKTGVAIEIAKKIGGEIISADSRAIYRGMDIGTAKPSMEEREGVPHFGFDLVEPGERFTVADWKEYAEEKIREIRGRGHIPIICGGTGLYIDALVYDYHFGVSGAVDRMQICTNFLLIGAKWGTDILRKRLEMRVNKLFTQDLYDECEKLVSKYGWKSQAMTSNIYQFVWRYLQGEIDLEEAKKLAFYDDWHLAKRQMTWFRRTPEINWLELEKICSFVVEYIQNEQRK